MDEEVYPWITREHIFYAGMEAAVRLDSWEKALDFHHEQMTSMIRRKAPELEVSQRRINECGILLHLERYNEAYNLLQSCREIFERERDYRYLSLVFSNLADLEGRLKHTDQAVTFGEAALRYAYIVAEPILCADLHNNVSALFEDAAIDVKIPVAHTLASTLLYLTTGSGSFGTALDNLLRFWSDEDHSLFPASFDELCTRVETTEGVHFRELFNCLPQLAGDGKTAMELVLKAVAQREPIKRSSPLNEIKRLQNENKTKD